MIDALAKLALRGASAVNSLPSLPEFAASLSAESRFSNERTLLERAGAMRICGLAGRLAIAGVAAIDPPPADDLRPISQRLTALLRGRLDEPQQTDNAVVLEEALNLMAATGHSLANELLPSALEFTHSRMREVLRPVLGTTGRWLAGFDSRLEWARAMPCSDERNLERLATIFEEATGNERGAVLERARSIDAVRALGWLETTWKKEKPEQRAALLECLQVGLTQTDEPFLEAALSDRSERVRDAAVGMLTRIPEAAFTRELNDRARSLMVVAPAATASTIQVNWPNESLIEWLGKFAAMPRSASGSKAGWLLKILSLIQPQQWTPRTALPAERIVQQLSSDWSDIAVRGLATAALRFDDADFQVACCESLLKSAAERFGSIDDVDLPLARRLLASAPPDRANAIIANLASASPAGRSLMLECCRSHHRPWSRELAVDFLEGLRADSSGAFVDHRWTEALATAGCFFPPECFAMALDESVLASTSTAPSAIRKSMLNFAHTIRWRQEVREELQV